MKILDSPRSGSYAGVTSSRNRYGQYVRNRSIPVNPGTIPQQNVRGRMALVAGAWRLLSAIQQAGWRDLGLVIARTDALGQSYNQTGFSTYTMVNMNRLAAGDAVIPDAIAYLPPAELTTFTPTVTTSTLSFAYTTTPLAAGSRLFSFASPQQSAGRFYNGSYRLIAVSAAAAASPANIFTAFQARFGTPVTGNKIFFSASVYLNGWMSSPTMAAVVV